eukprot:TRINITY_DN37814_c0_g1_i1.p1 TRINITY_DN37814_c0_g1~~TRINITY_DN37814_c0_g1_i1.p1  ORF type:complete len:458 (+),score=99.40 TRINITY_DN37814_c0_g1_i1:130-1503(+)
MCAARVASLSAVALRGQVCSLGSSCSLRLGRGLDSRALLLASRNFGACSSWRGERCDSRRAVGDAFSGLGGEPRTAFLTCSSTELPPLRRRVFGAPGACVAPALLRRNWSPVSRASAVTAPQLQLQLRSFAAKSGKLRRQQQLAKKKGLVGRALRAAPPPKLRKRALEQYVTALRAGGGARAREVIENAALVQAKGGAQSSPAVLTSEEKNALLVRYLPEEADASKRLRKHNHKWLWRWMMRRDWKRCDACFEAMREREVELDEITFNLAVFGALLDPSKDDEAARQLVSDMQRDGRFHPTLLRIQSDFVESYFDLKELDAAPGKITLQKVAKTFWHISVSFKRRRVRELRSRLAAAAGEQRAALAADGLDEEDPMLLEEAADLMRLSGRGSSGATYGAAGASASLRGPGGALDEEEAERRRQNPRAPWRPAKMRGVYRGCGRRNQRSKQIHRNHVR